MDRSTELVEALCGKLQPADDACSFVSYEATAVIDSNPQGVNCEYTVRVPAGARILTLGAAINYKKIDGVYSPQVLSTVDLSQSNVVFYVGHLIDRSHHNYSHVTCALAVGGVYLYNGKEVLCLWSKEFTLHG